MLQQRQPNIVTQPTGYVGSPANLQSQTVNLTPSDCVLPLSLTRSYGMRSENWMNLIPGNGSDIDPSSIIALELGPQAPNAACPDLSLPCPRVGSRTNAAENWESQSRRSRMSVSSSLDTLQLISRTPPDEDNPNLSVFDQPTHSDPSAGSLSADIELHLYV